MIEYKLFTKSILKVAVQEAMPISWADVSTSKRKLKYGSTCNMCSRHKTRIATTKDGAAYLKPVDLTPISIKASGDDHRTLLVVVDNTSKSESLDKLREEIRSAGFNGRIVIDFAVKCGGGRIDKVSGPHIDKCRPHLAYTYHAVKPDLVLLCGTRSTKAFLGETVSVHKNTGLWQVMFEKGEAGTRSIPVVMTHSPPDIAGNYIIRKYYARRDLHFLFNTDWDAYELPTGKVLEVEDEEDAYEALKWARDASWLAFDTETTGRFFKGNLGILCIAFARHDSDVCYVFGQQALENRYIRGCVEKILTKCKLVGHNVKYDQHAVREGLGVEAARVVGCTRLMMKLKNADADASLEQLSRYVGIGNHKRQMDPQVKRYAKDLRAKAELGMGRKLGKHEYDPMSEAYGLVDLEDLHRYCALDTYVTAMLYARVRSELQNHKFLYKTWTWMVLPANNFFYRMEMRGIPVSTQNINTAKKFIGREVNAAKSAIEEATGGRVDPDSTASLIRFLESEGIDTGKRTDGGRMQTRSKDLKSIRDRHTVLSHMLEYRKAVKLQDSYIETLPHFIGTDGRVHPSVLVDGTRAGGRISIKDPAVQTIPSGKDNQLISKMVKNCFVAPYVPGDDYVIICADFKTLEIYVGAAWANDKVMIEALKSGKDFHTHTAMGIAPYVWGQTAEQVYEEITADLASPTGSSPKRGHAKRLTFSTMYGMQKKTLSEELGVPVAMADDMIKAFFTMNHGLAKRMEEVLQFARKHGYTYAEWDGVPFRERPLLHIGYKDAYRYNSAENASKNTPIQSQAADICTRAAMDLEVELLKLPTDEAWVALTVHDSIMVISRYRSASKVMDIMRECMTSQPCGELELKVDIEIGKAWGSMISEKAWKNGETF